MPILFCQNRLFLLLGLKSVIAQGRKINGGMTVGNHFGNVIARSRGDAEAVSSKGTGDVQAGDFFHRADDRNLIGTFIKPVRRTLPCQLSPEGFFYGLRFSQGADFPFGCIPHRRLIPQKAPARDS